MDKVLLFAEDFLKASEPFAEELFKVLNQYRLKVNSSCQKLEPWQLIAITMLSTWLLISVRQKAISLFSQSNQQSSSVSTWKTIKSVAFKLIIRLPFVSGFARKEINKTVSSIMSELHKPFKNEAFSLVLPSKGLGADKVLSEVTRYTELGDVEWQKGRVSGGIYSDGSDFVLKRLMRDTYGITSYTNPLHPDVFPGIRKMEAEVVRMTCSLFKGDSNTCGCMTTGGTESLIMASKAYRDYARDVRGIDFGEMVVPITAHAGFDKAAQLLNMKIVHVPVDKDTMKVDLRAMRSAITSNTVMLVGSAPNFPNGIIDPIEEIAKIGLKKNIPVHVDSCLGGFLVPFMAEAGYALDPVDFSVPGVTSISADTHKYAYAPKGSSVLMYREPKYRHYQFSVVTDWPGGVYASPTISGSRAGGNIATCWAAMMYHGHAGYLEAVRKIMRTTRKLKDGLSKVEGLFLYGDPLMSVLAMGSDKFEVMEMGEKLSKRGWNLNTLQFPAGFHICVTLMHTADGVADQLLEDIKEVAAGMVKDGPNSKLTGQAAVYGMAQALPDRSLIGDFAKTYLDAYYCTHWDHLKTNKG